MKSISQLLLALTVVLAGSLPSYNHAQPVQGLEDVQREMRIVADVVKSVLREELGNDARVTRVTPQYLHRQGVLLTIAMNSPWLTVNSQGDTGFAFNGEISIPEIPQMVEEILTELQIPVAPHEPESLGALRELRTEQRELRANQRETRSELRKIRRELVRAEDSDEREDLETEIQNLEQDLANLEVEYEGLSQKIDQEYQVLKQDRAVYSKPRAPKSEAEVDQVIANAICNYGATLRSLNGNHFLTVALDRGEQSQYYTFRMEHVKECGRDNLRSERLLELAYQYAE